MPFETIFAFWMLCAALVVIPGPDWAYMIAAGPCDRVVPAVAGLLTGYVGMTIALGAGIGVLLEAAPILLTIITVLGACYLIWLGVRLLRFPPSPKAGNETVLGRSDWFVKAIGVSGFNPKALLLLIAVIPQFLDKDSSWPVPVQIAVFGGLWIVNCGIVYTVVGFASRAILSSRPKLAHVIGRLSDAIVIVLAIYLLLDRIGSAM